MAGPAVVVDAPTMAVALMCLLLIAALVAVGIGALVKWLLKRNRK